MMKKLNHFGLAIMLLFTISAYAQEASHEKHRTTKQMMNISQMNDSTKAVSVQLIFEGSKGETRALQIKKDGLLKEHITETEAFLICVSGEVIYEDEKKNKYGLKPGDFVRIEPHVKHWVKGIQDSQLMLLK